VGRELPFFPPFPPPFPPSSPSLLFPSNRRRNVVRVGTQVEAPTANRPSLFSPPPPFFSFSPPPTFSFFNRGEEEGRIRGGLVGWPGPFFPFLFFPSLFSISNPLLSEVGKDIRGEGVRPGGAFPLSPFSLPLLFLLFS